MPKKVSISRSVDVAPGDFLRSYMAVVNGLKNRNGVLLRSISIALEG